MTTFDLKKLLLAGSAIFAVGALTPSYAHADATLTADVEWAEDANQASTEDDGTDAAADDAVDLDGYELEITNDQTNDDGGGVDAFDLGAVTDSASGGSSAISLDIDQGDGNAGSDFTIQTDSVSVNAAILVDNGAAQDGGITWTNAGELTTADATDGDFTVTIASDVDGNGLTMTNAGTVSIAGTTAFTSSDGAGGAGGASVSFDVEGDATHTGAFTATTVGEGDVLLNYASDVTFTGGLSIEEGVAASAEGIVNVTLDGTSAQTVTGSIDGATADEGNVTVSNTSTSGVTFMDDVGSAAQGINQISVNNDGNDQAVTFRDDVSTDQGLLLGDNSGADTVAATFDTQDAATSITGVLTGGASETVNVTVQGGNALNQVSGAWTGVDALTITGTGTELDSDAAITATAATVGSGATLDVGAGLFTGAITLSGTVNLTGAGGVTGNITGASGTLDVDADATVTGSVTGLDAIDVADNVTLTIDATTGNESVSADSILINDSGVDDGITFDLQGNTISLSSDIDTGTDGQGLVTIDDSTGAGTMTITSDIGSSTNALGVLAVSGAGANETVTTTGNLYVDAITLDDADVLQFLGTSSIQASGTISAANGTTDGVVTVGDGTTTNAPTVTFNGAVDIGGAFTANDGSTAIFAAAANDFDGAQSSDAATIQVNSTSDVTFASQTDADVTTWNIGVKKTAGTQVVGQVIYSGDTVDLETTGADTVNFIVEEGSQVLTVGASVLDNVFAGTGATAGLTDGATVTDNSFLYDFTLVEQGNNVDVTVAVGNSISSTATSSNQGVGDQLFTTLAGSTNTQINQIQGQLQSATTAEAVNDVLEAAGPNIDGGAVAAGLTVVNQTSSINATRLASIRNGETGMVAGNVGQGLSFWGQLFGTTGEQDERDDVAGYDVDTYGVAVGMDTTNLAEGMTVGLALSYADTEVDSKNSTSTQTDIDSYQIAVYGEKELDERTYVNGQLGYAWSDNDQTRTNVGGVSGLTANADYDSNQVFARVEAGRDYAMDGNLTLTPKVLANYVHYDADDYTETGAGGANLTVDSESMNVFEVGVGVDAAWTVQQANGAYLKPVLNLGVRHDLVGDEVEATSTFAGGGTAFNTKGFDPAQTTLDVGAGVTYFTTDNWEFSADYDYEFKSDYDSHSAALKAKYNF